MMRHPSQALHVPPQKVWVADWYNGKHSGQIMVYSEYMWFMADLMDQIVWFNSNDIVGSEEEGYILLDDFVHALKTEVVNYDRPT